MDSLGTIAIVVGLLAAIIGIPAAIVQVLQYRNERQQRQLSTELPILSAVADSPPTVPPNNLPSRGEFIGRQAEKEIVKEALSSRWPLVCIDGIGGIGKTSLALEVVAECVELSRNDLLASSPLRFDGFIWTSARDRELTLNDILDTVARTLDYPGTTQQALAEKREAVRKLLQAKRYLLVIDNFETISDEGVRDFLLALPEPTKALVTSRKQDLRQAWSVSLKGMDQVEAFALLRSEGHRLGLASVETAPDQDLLRVYQGTGGAPLAMKWAVGQIKQKGQSLDTVLSSIHSARGDVFLHIFARSWDLLTDNARRVLIVMPVFVSATTRDAIEAASDVLRWDLDEAIGQLTELWLMEASDDLDEARRRYAIHPLTRAFVGQKSADNPQELAEAWSRAVAWTLRFVEASHKKLDVDREIDLELPNILAQIDWCHANNQYHFLIRFRYSLSHFFREYGYWDDALHLNGFAVEAAEVLGNKRALALACSACGWIYRHRGDLEQANEWYEKALLHFSDLQDESNVWWARIGLADVARLAGDVSTAEIQFETIRTELEHSDQYHEQLTAALFFLSLVAQQQLRFERSDELARQAWDMPRDPTNYRGEASLLHRRGVALAALGRLDEAESWIVRSLAVNERHNIRYGIAWNKQALAEISEQRGRFAEARSLALQAQELQLRLGLGREAEETNMMLSRLDQVA